MHLGAMYLLQLYKLDLPKFQGAAVVLSKIHAYSWKGAAVVLSKETFI